MFVVCILSSSSLVRDTNAIRCAAALCNKARLPTPEMWVILRYMAAFNQLTNMGHILYNYDRVLVDYNNSSYMSVYLTFTKQNVCNFEAVSISAEWPTDFLFSIRLGVERMRRIC